MSRKQPHPVVFLNPTVPSDRFRTWVRRFGVSRLGRALGVCRTTVHAWVAKPSDRTPHIVNARHIIALSAVEPADGRPLTYEDVYGRVEVAR
jgi:hypothetical protein